MTEPVGGVFLAIGCVLDVVYMVTVRHGISEDSVMRFDRLLPANPPAGWCSVVPNNLVNEVLRTEYRVHQLLEVMRRERVAVQIDAAGRFQHAVHLQQTHRHHRQVGLHPLPVHLPRRIQQVRDGRMLVRDKPHPRNVQVVQRPRVLERRACRLAADRGCVRPVRVERRVKIDQVDGLAVQSAQDVEIVPRPDRLVLEVLGGVDRALRHRGTLLWRRGEGSCHRLLNAHTEPNRRAQGPPLRSMVHRAPKGAQAHH